MKITIITKEKSLYGLRLLNAFIKKGINISGILVVRSSFFKDLKLFKSVRERLGFWDTLIYSLEIMINNRIDYKKEEASADMRLEYEQLSDAVYYVDKLNSPEAKQILSRLNPDILILGQSGIVKKEILSIPRLGTLNAHPGILPEYRGIDVCKWAAYNKDCKNTGITVHWVDQGVDSGNILHSRIYEFNGNETLDTLEDALYKHCIEALTEAVASLFKKHDKGIPQQYSRAKQYYKMPRRLIKTARHNFKEFIAQGRTK